MHTVRSAAAVIAMLAFGPVLSAQIPGFGRPSHYEPNWKSIRRHPLPEWFNNAKLGIFIHWGLDSGDALYAILLDKPRGTKVTIQSMFPAENMTVQLLGRPAISSGRTRIRTIALAASLPGVGAVPYQVVRE